MLDKATRGWHNASPFG